MNDVATLRTRTDGRPARPRITLVGELDIDTAAQLREAVNDCLADHPAVLHLDLAGVAFCDCAGLSALLWTRRRAAEVRTRLCCQGPARPAVARVLNLTGTADLLGLVCAAA